MRYRFPAVAFAVGLFLVGMAGTFTTARAAGDTGGPPPTAGARHTSNYLPKALDVVRKPSNLAGLTERRAIVLTGSEIRLMVGSAVVRSRRFDASGTVSFADVARAVRDPGWVDETSPGVFLLRAAFAQSPGTSVSFAAPAVSTLRLASRPNVFVGGVGARADYRGVTVTSWDQQTQRPLTDAHHPRPFLLYENRSTLTLEDSDISYLGYDSSTAYGLSWREGSTGSMTGSVAQHNFFGAYTYAAHDIAFRSNVFRDNAFYGLDPHTNSTGLLIQDNDAYRNGSHGIVLATNVAHSVIRGNRSHDNGGDGIVLDERSNGIPVEHNVVEGNRGDGIVVLGSSDAQVRDNTVRSNRVGVRVNHQSLHTLIESNLVAGNQTGIELYDGAFDTLTTRNRIRDSASTGIVIEDAGVVSRHDLIEGGDIGMEIRAPARADGTVVRDAVTGVRVTGPGIAQLTGMDIEARSTGIDLERGAIARVSSSHVVAPDPTSGAPLRTIVDTTLAHPPPALRWIGVAGITFVLLALLLQFFHRARNRAARAGVTNAPAGVVNTR
jgi:parallel beta-helix repeat protein